MPRRHGSSSSRCSRQLEHRHGHEPGGALGPAAGQANQAGGGQGGKGEEEEDGGGAVKVEVIGGGGGRCPVGRCAAPFLHWA